MRSASSSTNWLTVVQLQLAGGHQVADAARRADHDVGAGAHALHLREAADAAQDGDDRDVLLAARAGAGCSSICNASSRVGARMSARVAKRRGCTGLAGQVLQHRQGECGGLAGAGLGDAEQIAACEQVGNGTCLDRRWLKEALVGRERATAARPGRGS